MLEVNVERLIFAPSERLWRELSPEHMPAWAQVSFRGLEGAAFAAGSSFDLVSKGLLGSRSCSATIAALEPGKKLKLALQGKRAGDEIEWILYSKNNSTRVAVIERFQPRGTLPALAKAMRRRRHAKALRALELRTTGQEVSPLYASR